MIKLIDVRKIMKIKIAEEAYSMNTSLGFDVHKKICNGSVVLASEIIELGVLLAKNAIPTIISGAVSPAALAIASKMPVITLGIAIGRVMIKTV